MAAVLLIFSKAALSEELEGQLEIAAAWQASDPFGDPSNVDLTFEGCTISIVVTPQRVDCSKPVLNRQTTTLINLSEIDTVKEAFDAPRPNVSFRLRGVTPSRRFAISTLFGEPSDTRMSRYSAEADRLLAASDAESGKYFLSCNGVTSYQRVAQVTKFF
ncbi:hypothetical protein [uncultured Tateyamaria sp.]|uniref:hypothetical protein n=1 Tax=uncultured Tateyamaria sp. TaxID=455651 RepID=UPI002622AFD3|nr:hypothetical protein [uncultured Tateyamaria sp.]